MSTFIFVFPMVLPFIWIMEGSSAPNMCATSPMYRFCGTWDSCDGVVVRAAIVAGCLFSNACLRRSFLGSRSYLFAMH